MSALHDNDVTVT